MLEITVLRALSRIVRARKCVTSLIFCKNLILDAYLSGCICSVITQDSCPEMKKGKTT